MFTRAVKPPARAPFGDGGNRFSFPKRALTLALFIALAVSFACSDSAPPDSAVRAAAPAQTPTPPATPTPQPSPTPSPTPTATPTPTPTPATPSVISHSAAVSGNNPLIAFVSVSLSAPARVAVEYENEYAGKFRTAFSARAAEHNVPVARLRADAVYEYAVAVEKPDGALEYAARGEFRSEPLPPYLAAATTKTAGRSSLPLILGQIRVVREHRHMAMWDELGETVYIYEDPDFQQLVSPVWRVLPNGDIAYSVRGDAPVVRRATPLGEIVDEIPLADIDGERSRPHHEFLALSNGEFLYIGRTCADTGDGECGTATNPRVDTIEIVSRASPRPRRVLDTRDFWEFDIAEWSANPDGVCHHLNSVEPSPDGGWIVSNKCRQVISLSADFQTVRWRLGGPGGDFGFPDPSDRFSRLQHTAAQLPDGNILAFDNSAELPNGGCCRSRALELSLDFETMTAAKAWEFSPEPPMHAPSRGSAYRLDNGNTLIDFGVSEDVAAAPIAIIEADAEGREVFRLETHPPTGEPAPTHLQRYRVNPGPESIIGETTLRPPKERPQAP